MCWGGIDNSAEIEITCVDKITQCSSPEICKYRVIMEDVADKFQNRKDDREIKRWASKVLSS